MSSTSYRGGYLDGRQNRLRGLALTTAAHAALLPLIFFGLSHQVVAVKRERLTTINLTPPAAPPPPKSDAAPDAPPVVVIPPTRFALPDVPQVRAVLAPPAAAPAATPTATEGTPGQGSSSGASPAPPAPPAPPSTITSDSLESTLISGTPPRYPLESRRKKEQGTVRLLLIVGTDGRVEEISVLRSSGFSRLDQAALKAVRTWRWKPTRIDGNPITVRGIVEIPFVLTLGRKSIANADCDSPDAQCSADKGSARNDRRGRVDRRDSDVGASGPDDEE